VAAGVWRMATRHPGRRRAAPWPPKRAGHHARLLPPLCRHRAARPRLASRAAGPV